MDVSGLQTQLRAWVNEFAGLRGLTALPAPIPCRWLSGLWLALRGRVEKPPTDEQLRKAILLPEGLILFLAERLKEQGFATEDPGVVRARIGDRYRRVRINGVMGRRLNYEMADGSMGFGLCDPKDIHGDDAGRLSSILENFANGR